MERQDNKGSDHAIYCVAGIAILAGLAIIALHSMFIVHRVNLPILRLQAQMYALCPLNQDHAHELRNIDRIIAILDAEIAKTGDYTRIRSGVLKKAIDKSTARTREWTRNFTCVILGALGLWVIAQSQRARRRLLEGSRAIRQSPAQGVEEFLRITGKYLTPAITRQVRNNPTPESLANAFSIARSHVNIPCCRVARLFPKETQERIALLEYGKTRVAFSDDEVSSSPYKGRKQQI